LDKNWEISRLINAILILGFGVSGALLLVDPKEEKGEDEEHNDNYQVQQDKEHKTEDYVVIEDDFDEEDPSKLF